MCSKGRRDVGDHGTTDPGHNALDKVDEPDEDIGHDQGRRCPSNRYSLSLLHTSLKIGVNGVVVDCVAMDYVQDGVDLGMHFVFWLMNLAGGFRLTIEWRVDGYRRLVRGHFDDLFSVSEASSSAALYRSMFV